MLAYHRRSKSAATILTTEVDEPGGYGRIVREGNRLIQIVEGFDAPPELRAVKEVSLLAFVFRREALFEALPHIGRENRQREYYLNEVFGYLIAAGERVSALPVDVGGVMGINSRADLAASVRLLRRRINAEHLANGVTMIDPESTYIDVDVTIRPDTTILPNTYLEGATRIGANCEIGPDTRIVDSRVDDGASITFAVVKGARVGRDATVGPYVSIRPGTVLSEGAKAGTFVEIKNSKVGRGSKVPHLSYVGDADIGSEVNIGAANVFANYDGYEKHRTAVGNKVRTGSDTILVAPVRLGKGAVTGAGSVITKDVPAGALAVERSEQRVVKGYRKRKDDEARARGAGKRSAKGSGGAATAPDGKGAH
jgi:bifunctional UDP-N-acetylglucosamine pyrophosphorylase / glucosamine-1-phosphate N-acetyltransferase